MHVARILEHKGERVVTAEPSTTVAEVARTLYREHIGALLLMEDDGSIAGIISERDIIRALAGYGEDALGMPARELMARSPVTCTSETTVGELMSEMTERRIRHFPVVDDGRLSGIVSIGDVVKNRLDELKSEADELRNYVMSG
jgi:CBS domain-containing protein